MDENNTQIEERKHKIINDAETTYWEELKKVQLEDFNNVFKIPCTRTGLLYGVGGGLTLGSLHFLIRYKRSATSSLKQFITTKTVMASCHRAVASFAFISIIAWEKCKYDRAIAQQKVNLVAEQFKRAEIRKAEKLQKSVEASNIEGNENS